MYIALKKYFFLLFVLLPYFLFSQKSNSNNAFEQLVLDKSVHYNTNHFFFKAKQFFVEKEWDSTLVYTMKELSSSTKHKELIDYCHFLRGISFYEKKVFNEARIELLKISQGFKFHNNITMLLGSIALEANEFKDAINYFKKIETLSTAELYTIKKKNIKHNIGLCYLHLKQYDKAETYLMKSVQLQEKIKDTLELIGSYGDIANLYYVQYKDTQAIPYFKKAYQLAKTTHHFNARQTTAINMAIVEENREDYQKALAYRKEYDQWKDSMTNQNNVLRTIQLEKKLAIKDKEKEVSVLKVKNKVKIAERNTFLYSALILLLLLLVSVYFYREKVKANKVINAQKKHLDGLNATKDKLFSIVSHDLRSSVNAIKMSNKKLVDILEVKNQIEVNNLLQNNSSIVNEAYNLLDNLLNWAMLQTKQTYFEITKIRLTHIIEHVSYNYKAILADKEIIFKNKVTKEDVVYADKESLKIILRNLIDNAIKFTKSNGEITMYTRNEDADFCHIIMEDTGIGMDEKTRKDLLKDSILLVKKEHENIIGTGLGMQLCKSMIKKNKGTLSIESELEKGTKMIVSLPKKLPQ